jgi:hypothetical protein
MPDTALTELDLAHAEILVLRRALDAALTQSVHLQALLTAATAPTLAEA